MKPKLSPRLALLFLAAPALLLSASAARGQSAPAISAGGLLPSHSGQIAVAKETIHISDRKIVVEYDLRNDTARDVSSELEFPVPPYENLWNLMDPAIQSFHSLKVWAGDQPVEYKTETTAEVNGRDITRTLEKAHIDIATFGHLELGKDQHGAKRKVFAADYERLTKKEKHRLRSEGIFKGEEGFTLYTVHTRYHWAQTIPAHSTVHLRQEYTPVVGFMEAPPEASALQAAFAPASKPAVARPGQAVATTPSNPLGSFCADTKFVQTMVAAHKVFAQTWGQGIVPHWVDFDLLSETGWNKPIEDFTLVVDIPEPDHGQRTLVSFCSPGVVDQKDSDHPQVHLTHYTPGADLHIGFFNAPIDMPGMPVAAR
jgi:hypothetical protein